MQLLDSAGSPEGTLHMVASVLEGFRLEGLSSGFALKDVVSRARL